MGLKTPTAATVKKNMLSSNTVINLAAIVRVMTVKNVMSAKCDMTSKSAVITNRRN